MITCLTSLTSSRTSLSCSTMITLEPNPAENMEHGATHCWRTFASPLLSRALLRSRSALCTSHNVVAKKRGASTDPLRRLHEHMQQQHNVDFIGGDFNMSALSTVGDCVLGHRIFHHFAIRFCGDLVRWRSRIVSARGFSSCRSDHMSGVWIHMAAASSIMQTLQWGPRDTTAHIPIFLHLRTTNLSAPTALRAVNKPNKGVWNAKPPGTSDGSGDVDERDVVRQDHVSANLPTPSAVTSESLAGQLFPTALTLGHSLSLCLSLSLSLTLSLSLSLFFFLFFLIRFPVRKSVPLVLSSVHILLSACLLSWHRFDELCGHPIR